MKVGQSLLVKRQLGMEKQLKEKMIHSVMPPKVADWLMKGGIDDDEDDMDIDSETGNETINVFSLSLMLISRFHDEKDLQSKVF